MTRQELMQWFSDQTRIVESATPEAVVEAAAQFLSQAAKIIEETLRLNELAYEDEADSHMREINRYRREIRQLRHLLLKRVPTSSRWVIPAHTRRDCIL